MASSREGNILVAKLSEQAERFEDMTDAMVAAVKQEADLNTEERNLLSVAFKNVVGSKRSALRVYGSMLANTSSQDDSKKALKKEALKKVEKELVEKCEQVIDLLDKHLIPKSEGKHDSHVFYLKMKGDYYRYLAEAEVGPEYTAKSKESYERALSVANDHMQPTNAIRLGLALNFSVFLYEIEKDSTAACEMAKKAFEDAVAQLDSLPEEDYKDTVLIVQLLRDNLTLWSSAEDEEDADQ